MKGKVTPAPPQPEIPDLISAEEAARWITSRREFPQAPVSRQGAPLFLDAEKFSDFARKKGVPVSRTAVEDYWSLGLLPADLITSNALQEGPSGLTEIGSATGSSRRRYADTRELEHRDAGLTELEVPAVPDELELLFHPYRLLNLLHLETNLSQRIGGAMRLTPLASQFEALTQRTELLRDLTADPAFTERIREIHRVTRLAIVAQPLERKPAEGTECPAGRSRLPQTKAPRG